MSQIDTICHKLLQEGKISFIQAIAINDALKFVAFKLKNDSKKEFIYENGRSSLDEIERLCKKA